MHALRSFQCFDWSVGLATMSFVWMHNPSLEKYNFLLVTYWYCPFSGWLPKQTFSSSFLIYRESLYQVSSFRTASTTITTNFNYKINTELKLLIIRLLPCFKHAQLSQCKCILSHSGEKKMHLWANTMHTHVTHKRLHDTRKHTNACMTADN